MKSDFLRLIEVGIMGEEIRRQGLFRISIAVNVLFDAMQITESQIEATLMFDDKDLEDMAKEFIAWKYHCELKPVWLKKAFISDGEPRREL